MVEAARGVCELGIEHYSPGFAAYSPHVPRLAEVLRLAGYRTAASDCASTWSDAQAAVWTGDSPQTIRDLGYIQ